MVAFHKHQKVSRARSRRFLIQRLIGIFLLAICAVMVLLAFSANPGVNEDASPVLFFAPLGAYLVFTKHLWLIF